MKKITIITTLLLISVVQVFAQKEFKLAKSSGKLVINNISNLSVEGYDGKDIIFTTTSKVEKTDDPRAAGLSTLGSSGFDNTGIGISVTEKDNNVVVAAIAKELSLKVKLPQGVALSFKTNSFAIKDSTIISLSNIKAEIDASTQEEHISLKNVTGPISIKTLRGNIEGKLSPSFKGPISLVSVYGFIDVSLPENAKADMSINTVYETLYAAKDINLVLEEAPKNNLAINRNYSGNGVTVVTSGNSPSIFVSGVKAEDVNEAIINGKPATVITSDGKTTTTKVKGSTTTPSVETVTTTTTSLTGKGTQLKSGASITGSSPLSYSIESPISSIFTTSGTVVNGKLNGGGEKIVLKSTYGKIYLRK